MAEPAWLRGFCLQSLGGGVRSFLRPAKIQWICNIFLVTTVNWIICGKSTLSEFFGGILVKFKSHLLFLGVAGDSHKR